MQKRVIFRDRQEVQPEELNNLGLFPQESFDSLIRDAVSSGNHFTGFEITKNTATEIGVALGVLYKNGKSYITSAATTFNLYENVALGTQRYVALVAFGTEIDTDVEPRDFLIDLTTNTVEPQAVALEKLRKAELSLIAGAESADPQLPAIPDGNVLLGYALMDTTGIVSVTRETASVLPSASSNAQHITDLELWRGQTGPQIDALTTTVAGIKEQTSDLPDLEDLLEVTNDVAKLKEISGLPSIYSSYDADVFQDTDKTDTTLTGLTARIDNGLLFPDAATAVTALQLFNPIDPNAKKSADDFLLPSYTSTKVLSTTGYAGSMSLSAYQVQSTVTAPVTVSQRRWVAGWTYTWKRNYYSSYYIGDSYHYGGYYYNQRVKVDTGYWESHSTTEYRTTTTTESYDGVLVAQTFIAPRAMWATDVGLFFTQIGATGDVRVLLCEADTSGRPNMSRKLSDTLLSRSDMHRYPTETVIPINPVFLSAGKRYAVAFITGGNHQVARVSGNNFTQGTLFYGTDGAFTVADITKDLMFSVYAARFDSPRQEIILESVDLAGGITDLSVATEAIVPDGSDLKIEMQIAGIWYPISEYTNLVSNSPNVLPLRMVFLGTRDVAPGCQLGADRVVGSRAATGFTHYSTQRTLSSASTSITVTVDTDEWEETGHTLVCTLYDADGGPTSYSPDSTSRLQLVDKIGSESTTYRHTFTFTSSLGSGVDEYRIKLTGSRTTAKVPFSTLERIDIAV